MAHFRSTASRRALAAALLPLLAPLPSQGQSTDPGTTSSLAPVVVTGRQPAPASVAGWGDVPIAAAPLQASSIDAAAIRDSGARRLSDLARFDASVSEAYDTEGYVDYFTVRGFVIDNRFNFRRDGLPINAETSIPLENKARVDILKGLSGLQAGTSAPGGLVDLVVKRPLDAPLRSAFLEWRERGSVLGSADLSQRFGRDAAFGLRLNAAAERIDPIVRNAEGHRTVLALAGDWRASARTLVEAEVETSHRSQPSVPGFSLLGGSVPAVPDARLNLNNQPWSQPVVFDGTTASLRLTQRLAEGWRVVAHALSQRLRTDDRIAFPFGCTSAETYYADRYCPDGTFDLYDFRSDGERRQSRTLDVALHGEAATGVLQHRFIAEVQRNLVRNRFQGQAFNYAGTGNIEGTLVTPPAPDLFPLSTDRDEASSELSVRDAVAFGQGTTAWLGARHVQLARSGRLTDGTQATAYQQGFTTPFAAITHAFAPGQLAYASWGRGVESDVAPNVPLDASATPPVPRYSNAGQALPAAKSSQLEIGVKGGSGAAEWSAAVFDIRQPRFGDVGPCGEGSSCTRGLAGTQRHRGAEANASWQGGPWELRGGVQWLHARVETPGDPGLDGKRPTNVPALSARLGAGYRFASVPGASVQAAAVYEGQREVLPDNSAQIPSTLRVDLGARHELNAAGVRWTLRAGVENLFDRRAWRESPYQFDHAYLFPMAPRTWRLSLQTDL